jgi:hypothetical protein
MLAGIFTRADAVTWADTVIGDEDKPCSEVIDLSTSEGLDGSSFAALLRAIPGASDDALTKRILLARLGAKLAKGGDLAGIQGSLAQLAALVSFTDEEKRIGGLLAVPMDEQRREAAKLLSGADLSGKTRLLG